ncbi:MAG: hypothetical protein A3E78_10810 [Alphaproteobacteria bacterium RIFCSPHIGHO2_12_FULL_63_12]|nr:MAG: hypothetical protein A3E78_10810 [Alphaproteobacteria bacterium RIFCSPHIGHO2_12_FULL_63_12]
MRAANLPREVKLESDVLASLLLQKRNAFKFEKEVRLLWFDQETHQKKAVYIDINPAKKISQIMTSPYAAQSEHLEIKAFAEAAGIKAIQSGILNFPRTK